MDSEATNKIPIDKEYLAKLYEYRTQLSENINSSQDEYDKSIIQLSTAVIGASLVFLTDIAGQAPYENSFFLYSCWLIGALAIICVLTTFQISAKVNQIAIMETDNDIQNGYFSENNQNPVNCYNITLEVLNYTSGLLFLLCLSSLVLFAFFNIDNNLNGEFENDREELSTSQDQRQIKTKETTKNKIDQQIEKDTMTQQNSNNSTTVATKDGRSVSQRPPKASTSQTKPQNKSK